MTTQASVGSGANMSNEEMNRLIIDSSVEQYWPIITEGATKGVPTEEGKPPAIIPISPEEKIEEAKKFCESITIAGVEDKANYKLATQAKARVKKWRTSVESKRKELKSVALEYGRKVDGEAKRLTALIQPIEDAISAKIDAIDNILEEQRKAEQLRRHNLVLANEWQVMGSFYVCGAYTITSDELNTCTPERLDEIVSFGLDEKQRKEAEAKRKADEEAAAKADRERIAKENEELRAKLAAMEAANAPNPIMPTITIEHEEGPVYKVVESNAPAIPQDAAFGSAINEPEAIAPNPFAVPPSTAAPANTPEPFVKPQVGTVTAFDYGKGFEDCRSQVLELLNDPIPRKRSEFIELITALKPSK